MSDAMIGVIGTLMGTILGWILGRLDFGRLHIAFDNFIYEFGAPGSLFHIHGVQPNEVHSYKLSTTIQLYNSSNRNMILRNDSFIFSDGKTDLFSEEAYDDSTRRFVAKSLDYDKLEIVNIISIDDAELYNLKKVCDEVFGEENYVATLVYDKNRKNDAKYFSVGHEYMLAYFKSAATIYEMGIILRATKEGIDEVKAEFDRLRKEFNDDWAKVNEGLKALYASWPNDDERKSLARFTRVDEKGPYRDDGNISWPGGGGPRYDVLHPITGKPCKVPSRGWVYPNPKRMQEEIENGRVVFGKDETVTPKIRTNLFEQDKEVMRSVYFSYAQTITQEFMNFGSDESKSVGIIHQTISDAHELFADGWKYRECKYMNYYIKTARFLATAMQKKTI